MAYLQTRMTKDDVSWAIDRLKDRGLNSTTADAVKAWVNSQGNDFYVVVDAHIQDTGSVSVQMENIVQQLQGTINGFKTEVTNKIQDYTTAIETQLTDPATRITTAATKMTNAATKAETATTDMNSAAETLSNHANSILNAVSDFSEALGTIMQGMQSAETDAVSQISETISDVLGEQGNLSVLLNQLQNKISTMADTLSSQMQDLGDVHREWNLDVDTLDANIASVSAMLASLQRSLDQLSSSESSMQITSDNVLIVKNAINSLQTYLSTYVSTISSLGTKLDSLASLNGDVSETNRQSKQFRDEVTALLNSKFTELSAYQEEGKKRDYINIGVAAASALADIVKGTVLSAKIDQTNKISAKQIQTTKAKPKWE